MSTPVNGKWICDSREGNNLIAWWMIEFTDDGCMGTSSHYKERRGTGSCYYSISGNKITFKYDKPETYKFKLYGDKLDIETPFRERATYRRATEDEYKTLHVPVFNCLVSREYGE